MLYIILLLLGIIYAVRRPKLKRLRPEQFPNVPQKQFQEWRNLELQSVHFFLLATWGLLVLSIPAEMLFKAAFPNTGIPFTVVYLGLFFVLLLLSAIPGSKAAKLKKKYRIKWP